MLSKQQFEDIFPRNRNPSLWLPQFDILPDFNIKSDIQIAIFCATVGHESLDMTILEENLNYSSIALMFTGPIDFIFISFHLYVKNKRNY